MSYTVEFPITAVTDRSVTTLSVLKSHLGESGSGEDTRLTLILAAAKEAADEYMQNPFIERDPDSDYLYKDGPVTIAIPSKVEQGIIEWCRLHYEARKVPRAGVSARSNRSRASSHRPLDAAFGEIEETYWRQYRLIPAF